MQIPKLSALTGALRYSVLRFPLPGLFALLLTGLLIVGQQLDFVENSPFYRYAFLSALGFVLSLCIDLSVEAMEAGYRRRIAAQTAGLLALVGYGFAIMPEHLEGSRPPFWYGYFILIFMVHLGIALTPVLAGGGEARLWRFNLSCFLRFFFSSVNAALLFAGLGLALLSVDKLFGVGLDGELYFQLWIFCAFLVHPLICLSGLPNPSDNAGLGDFPKPLRFTLCFIGLPIIGVYLLILYAYLAKIGLQWDWPDGWVAMPIFILAVVSLLVYLLSLPLAQNEAWARHTHRWLFRLLLPLSIVLFLALQVRLDSYGMTINRYLGLALALWLFGVSLARLLRPAWAIAWMPASLLLVALFSIAAGPAGAFGWSQRAQTERIREMATTLGALEGSQLVPATAGGDAQTVRELESALRYVLDNFGPRALQPELAGFMARDEAASVDEWNAHFLTDRIMAYLKLDEALDAKVYFASDRNAPIRTGGLRWQLDYNYFNYRGSDSDLRSFRVDGEELIFEIDRPANTLSLSRLGERILEVDLELWAGEVSRAIDGAAPRQWAPLVFTPSSSGGTFRFVLINATLRPDKITFENATFTVFFDLEDKPGPIVE